VSESAGTFQRGATNDLCDVFQRHVIGDDVAVEMLEDLVMGFGLGIDEEVIGEAEEVGIGENFSLRVQKETCNGLPLAGEIVHVIGGHGVEQTGRVFTCHPNPATGAQIDQCSVFEECAQTGGHTRAGNQRSITAIRITATDTHAATDIWRARFELPARVARNTVAKTWSASRTFDAERSAIDHRHTVDGAGRCRCQR